MAVVLCIGSDHKLAQTRQLILEHAGHQVVTAFTTLEVQAACARQQFDVAVIGQGIPNRERIRIWNLLQTECPSARVLELYRPSTGKMLDAADDWMEVPIQVPEELAHRVTVLATRRRAKGKAG